MSPGRNPAAAAGTARGDVGDHDARLACEPEPARERRRDGLHADPDVAAPDAAGGFDLLVDRADDVARRRESDALVAAALRRNQRVDADQPAAEIDERTAAAPRVDRRIGLHPDHRRLRLELACDGADNPQRDRVGEPERAAECQHELTGLQRLGVGERHGRQLVALDLDDREIGLEVDPDDLRPDHVGARAENRRPRRRPRHLDPETSGAAHDVGIRDDVTRRIDDDTGARGTLGPNQIPAAGKQSVACRVRRREDLHHGRTDGASGRLECRAEIGGSGSGGRARLRGRCRGGQDNQQQSRGARRVFPVHCDVPFEGRRAANSDISESSDGCRIPAGWNCGIRLLHRRSGNSDAILTVHTVPFKITAELAELAETTLVLGVLACSAVNCATCS